MDGIVRGGGGGISDTSGAAGFSSEGMEAAVEYARIDGAECARLHGDTGLALDGDRTGDETRGEPQSVSESDETALCSI